MRAIFLIGTNFVRTQWVVVAIMLAYLAGIAGVFGWHARRSEVVFFLHLHSLYAVFMGTMVAVPALQNERKSRRNLAVLSKGIHRRQYVAGLLCGCVMVAALFCAVLGGAALWLARRVEIAPAGLAGLLLALLAAASASASVALFFSTFLHPVLALGAASTLALLPFPLEARGLYPPGALFPTASIMDMAIHFRFQPLGLGAWWLVAAAMAQALAFWLAASAIFARQDVTTASE